VGIEIDLLARYPKTVRDVQQRLESKSDADREIARKFGYDFFDGDRRHGYGGLNYDPRYWSLATKDIVKHFELDDGARILDVGCAKGFMLKDLQENFPKIEVFGVDISNYAIEHAHPDIKKRVTVADAQNLPFEDNSFDLVVSINTIHNLEAEGCAKALKEIQRVSSKKSFITVDAFETEIERQRMFAWNLTAKTIMSKSDWLKFFNENDYTGDYFWFIP
jgi:ubiquinone/menaquinone biosynthesis C-methylase UbiE